MGSTDQIIAGLTRDEFHLGIVEGEFDRQVFDYKVLIIDELILIAGPEHRWKDREMIQFSEVLEEQLVRRIANSELRERVEQESRKHHLLDKINTFIELETTQAVKNAVEYGLGISFVSRLAAEKELEEGRLIEVKIKDVEIRRPIYLVLKKGRILHQGTEKFLDMIDQKLKWNRKLL